LTIARFRATIQPDDAEFDASGRDSETPIETPRAAAFLNAAGP
jgi:hypothetical protein